MRKSQLIHALTLCEAVPPQRLARYWRQETWREDLAEIDSGILLHRLGLTPDELAAATSAATRDLVAEAERALAGCGGRAVFITDPVYPELLREIHAPPWVLYVRGTLVAAESVAVVGSRAATPYGTRAAEEIAGGLAAAGVVVVSGMARGIDAAAHRAALAAGGITVGVLACGVDRVYPQQHTKLAQTVLERGALISEMPPGMPPLAHNFPRRNRILSGMCRGAVIVEAAERSGSLITARFALEQDREVFAVPGSIFQPNGRGTNALLAAGARLATSAAGVLVELGLAPAPPAAPGPAALAEPLAADERKLLAALSDTEPTTVDTLAEKLALAAPRCLAALLTMEIKGIIKAIPGAAYLRVS